MISSQDNISQIEPPVAFRPEMVPCVCAFFCLLYTFLPHASAANLVSIRVRAALLTIAPVWKRESGVNVHVNVPRTVRLHLVWKSTIDAL
jgi:hypothetical protein